MKRYDKVGKLPNDELDELILSKIKNRRPEVIGGSSIGEDTAVLDLEGDYVVLSSDPITGAADHLGTLAINISVNDISTKSADAVGVLLTLLLPVNTTSVEIEKIMYDAQKAADDVDMDIIGGHTEITDAVTKPVMVSTVVGRVKKNAMPDARAIRPGYVVAMTKYAGLEGTAILCNDFGEELKAIGDDILSKGRSLIGNTSVRREGEVASKYRIGYMHDVTEGGIEGALWEASKAIGKGIEINKNDIPIHESTEKIAKMLNINPYRLISSGSMVIVMDERDVEDMTRDLQKDQILLTVIGKVVESDQMFFADEGVAIEAPGPDDLFKAIAQLQ